MRTLSLLLLLAALFASPTGTEPGPPTRPAPPSEAAEPDATAEERLEEFVPTEKISADTAVSFPVDI